MWKGRRIMGRERPACPKGRLILLHSQSHTGSFCGRTRREFLWEAGAGFTGLALTGLLSRRLLQ